MLTEEVKKSIDESILCWLATVDDEGSPNCSPKEIFTHFGDSQVVIANIASPVSVKNIETNVAVCVSFVHVFKQKGFKLKGHAKYIPAESAAYSEQLELVQSLAGESFPVKGIIVVEVLSTKQIIAPGYYLVPGTTEEGQVKNAKRAYGV
ncbi:pyridoxamine 5'-phosphate oxidase family protein [Marinomonas sp. TW1]|uniref:pyridoxamine 5'-phosphate oxidase family protein n=1 Tax=Marinomonas sp. TW1 TaxID=1561203 RepID=UPI0007AEFA78|nr:pyridoxamine 5'-phosphate oxidase family protein [Marinomonas sp. TW1]KZN12586.1 flavin-nucleotide-binding protein [Marinomonas sp. TW1]